MGMGGGGGVTQSQQSYGTSTSTPNLYSWKDILPPWVQSGQQTVMPWLMSRAATGLTPGEESTLWGQARDTIEGSSNQAGRNMARQFATSGISPTSGAAAGAFSDLASDKLTTTSKAATDFAKMKMGARDTAIGQLLTALYTPPPAAVGQTTVSEQRSTGSSGGGGGGK